MTDNYVSLSHWFLFNHQHGLVNTQKCSCISQQPMIKKCENYRLVSFPTVTGIYLTITVAICGSNVLIQMMIMNMYHVTPLRPVPRWLRTTKDVLSCRCCRRRGEVQPSPDQKVPEPEAGVIVDEAESKDSESDLLLLNEIRVLSEKVKSDEKENAMAEEWKEIAKLLDWWFFTMFALFQFIMAIVCFGILPAMQPKSDIWWYLISLHAKHYTNNWNKLCLILLRWIYYNPNIYNWSYTQLSVRSSHESLSKSHHQFC